MRHGRIRRTAPTNRVSISGTRTRTVNRDRDRDRAGARTRTRGAKRNARSFLTIEKILTLLISSETRTIKKIKDVCPLLLIY